MSPDDFAGRMRVIAQNDDHEVGHGRADDLLVEVLRANGYDEGCDVYDGMTRWYA